MVNFTLWPIYFKCFVLELSFVCWAINFCRLKRDTCLWMLSLHMAFHAVILIGRTPKLSCTYFYVPSLFIVVNGCLWILIYILSICCKRIVSKYFWEQAFKNVSYFISPHHLSKISDDLGVVNMKKTIKSVIHIRVLTLLFFRVCPHAFIYLLEMTK